MRPRDERPYEQATRQMPLQPPARPSGTPPLPGAAPPNTWTPGGCSPAIFLVAFLVLLLLAGAGLANQRRGQPVPAPTRPVAPGNAAAGPTTAAPDAVYFIVGNTGGDGVYLRRTPRLADRDRAYPDGTKLEQIGPNQDADGKRWRHVRAPDGRTGWVPAQYTVPAP